MALNSRTMFDVGSLLWILKSSWKVAKTKRKIDNNELRWPTIYSTHAQPPHGWRTNTGEFTRIARALWIYIHPSIQLPYKECAMERIPEAMESFVWIRENPVRSRSVSPVCYIVCAVKYVATTYTNIFERHSTEGNSPANEGKSTFPCTHANTCITSLLYQIQTYVYTAATQPLFTMIRRKCSTRTLSG